MPLIVASKHKKPETVQYLLSIGADPNLVDCAEGQSSLMVALQCCRPCFDPLIAAGANPYIPNKQGMTPFHEAIINPQLGKLVELQENECTTAFDNERVSDESIIETLTQLLPSKAVCTIDSEQLLKSLLSIEFVKSSNRLLFGINLLGCPSSYYLL